MMMPISGYDVCLNSGLRGTTVQTYVGRIETPYSRHFQMCQSVKDIERLGFTQSRPQIRICGPGIGIFCWDARSR
jgi:hypothetical protein